MNQASRSTSVGYLAKAAYKLLGHVSYNGVKFPPYVKVEVEREPRYSSDGRSVEAIDLEISVSGVVIPEMFVVRSEGDTPAALQPLDQQPFAAPDSQTIFDPAIPLTPDKDFEIIRSRLEKPGGVLEVVGKGFGRIIVSAGVITTEPTPTSNPQFKSYHYYDIDNGPKPGKTVLRSYGPKAVYVEWKITAAIYPCDTKRTIPSVVTQLDIMSLTYTTDLEVRTNLTVKRTIRGKLKLPAIRKRQQSPIDPAFREYLSKTLFPLTSQFRRTLNFGHSEDKTELRFSLIDEEIASDSALPKGFADIQADHSVESSLDDGGFEAWNGSIAVSGEVYPGYSKVLIWLVWTQIINALINNPKKPPGWDNPAQEVPASEGLAAYAEEMGIDLNEETVNLVGANPVSTSKEGKGFITSIRIKDNIFSRKASVECSYKMFTSLNRILVSTGVLQPLPPWLIPNMAEAWNNWAKAQKDYAHKGYLYQMPLDTAPGYTPVDVCAVSLTPDTPSAWTQPYPNFRNEKDSDSDEDATALTDDNEGYLAGKVSYRVEEDRDVHHYRYLQDSTGLRPSPAKAVSPDATGLAAGLLTSAEALGLRLPDGETIDPGNPNTVTAKKTSVRSVADERRTLIVEGYFLRVGSPPVVPEVVGVGKVNTANQNLPPTVAGTAFSNPTKVGKDIVIRKTLGAGIVMKNGQTAQVYAVAFRKSYALRHELLDGTVIMNNTPRIAGVS